MRRKIWSTLEAPDTLRVQALRELPVGGEGGFGIQGGEGSPAIGGEGGFTIGGEGSPTVFGGEGSPLILGGEGSGGFMAEIRAAGGEGGGSPG